MIDKCFITNYLTVDDPWCFSHGSGNGSEDLGAGMLYYGLAYSLKARTCVCLGSGGGFVPRMMRQAQRDLELEESRTILVDGGANVDEGKREIWGTPCWLAEDSPFRQNFPDIDLVLNLTEAAHQDFFVAYQIQIDYLHIDADHHYEGVRQDWDLYSPLVSDQGVITLHDTVNYRKPCGVYLLLEEIRREGHYEMVNLPVSYGTAVIKKHQDLP